MVKVQKERDIEPDDHRIAPPFCSAPASLPMKEVRVMVLTAISFVSCLYGIERHKQLYKRGIKKRKGRIAIE